MSAALTPRPPVERPVVVVPTYNEAPNIAELVRRVAAVVEGRGGMGLDAEIVFVDDGSSDDTLARIRARNQRDPRIGAISFSHRSTAASSFVIRK